jgi:hypothetical protein
MPQEAEVRDGEGGAAGGGGQAEEEEEEEETAAAAGASEERRRSSSSVADTPQELFVWVDAVLDCLTLLRLPLWPQALHSRVSGARLFASAYAGVGTMCKRGGAADATDDGADATDEAAADADGLPCSMLPGFSVKASFFAAHLSTFEWLASRYTRTVARALSQVC